MRKVFIAFVYLVIATFAVADGQSSVVQNLGLAGGGTLRGTVIVGAGPLPAAVLVTSVTPPLNVSPIVQSDGTYLITALPPGTYSVGFSTSGRLSRSNDGTSIGMTRSAMP